MALGVEEDLVELDTDDDCVVAEESTKTSAKQQILTGMKRAKVATT